MPTDLADLEYATAELLEAIMDGEFYRDIDAGCDGNGPVTNCYLALGKPIPKELVDYNNDDGQ